jgi:hypothetical protein
MTTAGWATAQAVKPTSAFLLFMIAVSILKRYQLSDIPHGKRRLLDRLLNPDAAGRTGKYCPRVRHTPVERIKDCCN